MGEMTEDVGMKPQSLPEKFQKIALVDWQRYKMLRISIHAFENSTTRIADVFFCLKKKLLLVYEGTNNLPETKLKSTHNRPNIL